MDILTIIISGIGGLAGGFGIAKTIEKSNISNLIKSAKKEAASILKDANLEAENIKKDKILQAKEKFIELKSEHEQVILSRDQKMAEVEKRIRDKESQVSNELSKAKKINDDFEAKTTEGFQHVAHVLQAEDQAITTIVYLSKLSLLFLAILKIHDDSDNNMCNKSKHQNQ